MKLAVFFHGVLATPLASLGDGAAAILAEQMQDLKQSGLADACDELHIGMNDADLLTAAQLAPDKAVLHPTGDGSHGEKPTLMALQSWVPSHDDGWLVCYHHMKGVTNGKHESRRCMAEAVILNWRQCVHDLELGYDAVGCHWLDWRRSAIPKGHRIFGGNFWWATQRYLSQLPPLNEKVDGGRYFEGEIWLGRHPGEPRVRDYHRPGRPCAL